MAKTAKISRHSWNYILKYMDIDPDEVSEYETIEDNGNHLYVKVSVDGWYKLKELVVLIYDNEGNELEHDAEQYILLQAEIEDILAELSRQAIAEAQYERWLLRQGCL